MSEASEIKDEQKAEAQFQREKEAKEKEAAKHSFSVNLGGMKDDATKQLGEQVKDSALAGALKAILAAAPGNSASVSGTMESSADGKSGKLNIVGHFKTVSDEDIKARKEADAAAEAARKQRESAAKAAKK